MLVFAFHGGSVTLFAIASMTAVMLIVITTCYCVDESCGSWLG